MLSQRSTRWLASVLALLALAGCASGPKPAADPARADVSTGPDGQPAVAMEIPPRAMTLYEQAVAIMAAGDTIDAELRFQQFLLEYPNYAGAYVNLAIIFADRDDFQGAENSLTDALILSPEHPAALNQLGMLLRRQGKFQEAEAAYTKAVAANPDYALAHYNLGVLNDLYQQLAGEDQQVSKWIADLKRRISAGQRTANVTE
jgi:tetratricopeptide (TPR) repeat protein